jgi:hypothetical protein
VSALDAEVKGLKSTVAAELAADTLEHDQARGDRRANFGPLERALPFGAARGVYNEVIKPAAEEATQDKVSAASLRSLDTLVQRRTVALETLKSSDGGRRALDVLVAQELAFTAMGVASTLVGGAVNSPAGDAWRQAAAQRPGAFAALLLGAEASRSGTPVQSLVERFRALEAQLGSPTPAPETVAALCVAQAQHPTADVLGTFREVLAAQWTRANELDTGHGVVPRDERQALLARMDLHTAALLAVAAVTTQRPAREVVADYEAIRSAYQPQWSAQDFLPNDLQFAAAAAVLKGARAATVTTRSELDLGLQRVRAPAPEGNRAVHEAVVTLLPGADLLGDTIGAACVANGVAAFAQDPRALASALTCFDPRELAVARWLSLAQSGRG